MAKAEYRSAIRSRKLITRALADLLQEKPLDKITVTDVVRRAEVNRGTFYAHYTDIPGVLRCLIEQIFDRIRQAALDASCQPLEVPHALLAAIQEILEEDTEFCRKVMTSSASAQMEDQLVQLMLDYLLQHEDLFGFGNHEEYDMTIRFCAGGLATLYRTWFAGLLPISLDELTHQAELLVHRCIPSTTERSISAATTL